MVKLFLVTSLCKNRFEDKIRNWTKFFSYEIGQNSFLMKLDKILFLSQNANHNREMAGRTRRIFVTTCIFRICFPLANLACQARCRVWDLL